MDKILRTRALTLFLALGLWSCGDDGNEPQIVGPDIQTGPGRVYPVKSVDFPSIDGVQVGALFGQIEGSEEKHPVVILIHDFILDNSEWSQTNFFIELLEQGYLVLAINLRGHGIQGLGNTPLPGDRPPQQLTLEDLENMYLDVHAALTWLRDQPGADATRIAVVGSGVGGNVAYVSMGAFPQQIRTAVALSPGLWDVELRPVVIGSGLEPFTPHSMLFMVGSEDVFITASGDELNYPVFTTNLESITADPKVLTVVQGASEHGAQLLNVDGVSEAIFTWLADQLK